MSWIKLKWFNSEYKTKFYIILTAAVIFLAASTFLFANLHFYKSGANLAALTQRANEIIPIHSAGIVTILDSCPPFQWMGKLPDETVTETDLPYRENGSYVVSSPLEDTCLRLIQAGFFFDTSGGGTTLISKSKTCYLYFNDRTLIAQIEDLEEHEND